ncbi:hypothetical protein Pst134EA_030397 [Puccinia striiformis f. sp. tritici]|uniref:Pre-rRNA-processing protein RIX1 n=2 Tax=Puccinia striiformis f. sp. tritici TaxID=168172 RepID=A0A0L0UX83_9BASI|nr:hypothetical protein Pst134EA_030397 [Puccinia striiformis f. sp. tritici]KAH9440311.1 hypothetical protein Pst134EB_030930 [Puccinia striiformis f. sp. tritici]KAH9446479.1 hypothetical protein Pst134EA_030397 [Puccinia striiformis f. sp. tritici]KAI9600431.1 hypothetical protein H4Q26_000214 [Puccinia striiformis f. sp. tritici PST-130]KNE91531.1 hypothetical protein PSTG_15052 [Puccinia striiformis f. sp. tritici PST-78]
MGSNYYQTIDYLLNTHLAPQTNINSSIANSVCTTFDQTQPKSNHQQSTELNKWFNRINSLLTSKNEISNSLGARLAKLTLHKDQNCLTNQGARWILASQNIIARQEPVNHICLAQVIDLILNIFEWANRWPDFARENCDPKAIITLAKALIAISEERIQDPNIRSVGIQTLAILITRYASIMRPLASQLQTLALTNLLNPEKIITQSGTTLLTQLYRLSGKTDASASWSKTIKATIGTIDIVLDALLTPFLKETGPNSTRDIPLAPLEIPPQDLIYSSDSTSIDQENTHQPSYRIPMLLRRTDRLINVLLTMLSQPTDRSVSVPLGELSALASRLLLLGKAQIHDRADQAWRLGWEALGATVTLRAMGCRMIARLAECVTFRLTPFTSQILRILSSEIESNHDPKSGHKAIDVPVMYATYARMISRCPCNPDVIKTTLEPIIKVILQDIQPIYGSLPPSDSHSTDSIQKKQTKNRKKSGRYACDPTWNTAMVVDLLELRIAERALVTLEILFGVIPHGFPSPYLTLCVRTVLNLATHPSFITPGGKPGNGKTGILSSSSTSKSPSLGYASLPSLRLRVLSCLVKCIPIPRTSNQELMGLNLAQSLSGVLEALLSAQDTNSGRLTDLARQALAALSLLARPRVPPIFPTAAHAHLELDTEPVHEQSDSETEQNDDDDKDTDMIEQPIPSSTIINPKPIHTSIPSLPTPSILPWKSNLLSSLNDTEAQEEETIVNGDNHSAKKRKSLDDDHQNLPDRPLKKTNDHHQRPVLAIEPDSSDDDDEDLNNGGGLKKLPQLTFDEDDDQDEEDTPSS